MSHDAVREPHEHHRILGPFAAHFLDVRQVVHADAEQFRAAVGNHRQERNLAERVVGPLGLEPAERGQRTGDEHVAQAPILGAEPLAGVDHAVSRDDAEARPTILLEAH